MLTQQNLVLNVEVRDIVVKVHIFRNHKSSNHLLVNTGAVSEVAWSEWVDRVRKIFHQVCTVVIFSTAWLDQFFDLFEISFSRSGYTHILLEELVSVQDVEDVRESVFWLLLDEGELVH